MTYNLGPTSVNTLTGQKSGGGASNRYTGRDVDLKRDAVDRNDFGLNDKRFDSLVYPL